jgi:hypothetical protein
LTLVISAICDPWVVQVSDRRLVWLEGDVIRRRDDERNKAVLWCSRLAFAYTGLAELGMERRTDLWLANRLKDIEAALAPEQDLDQAYLLGRLAELSTDYFRGPRVSRIAPALRRHAFVAAGWARFGGTGDFSPYMAVISNFHCGGQEIATAEHRFTLHVHRLATNQDWLVLPIGYRLSALEINELGDQLSQATGDATRAVEVLGAKVRDTADKTDTVGKGLMINMLPRSMIQPGQREHLMLLGGPRTDAQTFLYVSPGEDLPGVSYGPTFVCGGSVMSGFTAESL